MSNVVKKYANVLVKLSDGRQVKFDPNDAEQVVESINQMVCCVVESSCVTFSQDHLKTEWRSAVAANETELSFESWVSKRPLD